MLAFTIKYTLHPEKHKYSEHKLAFYLGFLTKVKCILAIIISLNAKCLVMIKNEKKSHAFRLLGV